MQFTTILKIWSASSKFADFHFSQKLYILRFNSFAK